MTEKTITITLSGSEFNIGRSAFGVIISNALKAKGLTEITFDFPEEESMDKIDNIVIDNVLDFVKNNVKLIIKDGGITTDNSQATYVPVKFQNLNSRNDIPPSMLTAVVADVEYLRSRNRWTHKLENLLIELHKSGSPPNMMSFGSTKETQRALMSETERALIGITTIQRMDQSFLTQYKR